MTTTGGAAIDGWVAPGFEPVRTAFQKNFEHGEVGAAYAAYHHGHQVVDLWGGTADATKGRPWEEDTMVLVYSSTKGVTAMCANRLAQEGRIDVDAPVATYWPEFAQAGKEGVTVADLLAHRAGLAWVDGSMTIGGSPRLGSGHRRARATDPVLASWLGPRLPRHHLRLAGGRGGAEGHWQEPGVLPP